MLRACATVLTCVAASAALAAAPGEVFDATVPQSPVATPVEGRCLLRHELHLANVDAAAHTLDAVTLLRGEDRLLELRGDALVSNSVMADMAADTPSRTLPPGARAIVFLDSDIACDEGAATQISHRIAFDTGASVETPAIPLATLADAPLGAPLRGGPWVAVASPVWPRGHRRVYYAPDGVARLPGRYAIDFVRIDDAGRITDGDADRAADAFGYGDAVLAVADARVAAARNDVQEAERVSANGKHPLDRAAGNHVSLQLADGRFAIYEHLRPGSVTVRVGDRVKRGQVIGQLGFSGDSTGPHLHFHVADAAEPLRGEGLPYTFARFDLLGRYPDLADLGARRWQARDASLGETRRGELPGANRVLRFAD